KCSSIALLGSPERHSIYIGDGRSDLCAARRADFVFAKDALADCLQKEGIPFVHYTDLSHITSYLITKWGVDFSIKKSAGLSSVAS
ncbi:MAG TPA: hypothetical protein VF857_06840, partial [Spirochaetota bacterium]